MALIPPLTFTHDFPINSTKNLITKYKVSSGTIGRWARSLGLSKTPEHLSKIQSERTKDRIFSDSSRQKLREKAIGRVVSSTTITKTLQTKIRNGTIPKGSNHYKWKGGRTWERFKDSKYIDWRNSVLSRDNYICQNCKTSRSKHEKGLAAHHIKEYSKFPELRYDIDNGLTLCRQCHMKVHGKEYTIKMIPCACGCGNIIPSKDKYGRNRKYVNHHGRRKSPMDNNTGGDRYEENSLSLRQTSNLDH